MADVTISDLTAGVPNSSAVLPYSNGSTTLKATVGQVGVPIGTIVMWNNRGGASIPTNWALCDGTNGTPDLRDRFIVGYSASKAINTTGGSATASGSTDATVLTTAQIPVHSHTATDSGHSHVVAKYAGGLQGGANLQTTSSKYGGGDYSSAAANANITVGNTGGGTGHSHTVSSIGTIPPYYALAFIQKIS
jgi:microcystin-dependent protein